MIPFIFLLANNYNSRDYYDIVLYSVKMPKHVYIIIVVQNSNLMISNGINCV